MKNLTQCALTAAVLVMAGAGRVDAAAAEFTTPVTIELRLESVMRGQPMELSLQRDRSGWHKHWFRVPRFNASMHQAIVVDGTVTDDRIELDIITNIRSDAWIKGGWGRYAVVLARNEKDRFSGTYKGVFQDKPCGGEASALLLSDAADAASRRGNPPVKPDEHPRLMFRKADLPALKAKAKTPFGQAALAKLNGVIGLALRYQLEGDPGHAEKAIPGVKALMADSGLGDKAVRGRVVGWRMEQVALVYDLCYDAWTPEMRDEVERYFIREGWLPFTGTGTLHQEIAWDPRTTYPGAIRYGPALGALAIWGRKGPQPEPPTEPDTDVPVVEPDRDYKPGNGVTVCEIKSGTMPPEWLIACGFPDGEAADPLTSLGGGEKARPEVGTKVKGGEKTDTFRAIPHEQERGHFGTFLDMARGTGRQWYTVALLYTVLRSDGDQVVQIHTGNDGDTIFLAGQALRNGDVMRLKKGLYPVLIRTLVGKTNAWGRMAKKPHLVVLTPADLDAKIAKLKRDYVNRMEFYKTDLRLWENTDGMDVPMLNFYGITRQSMMEYVRKSFGIGGFKTGEIGSLHGPNRYVVAYRNAFGEPLTPEADIEMYLPRVLFLTDFRDDDRALFFQDMRSDQAFSGYEYGGAHDYSANYFGGLFPIVPETMKPATLWGWWQYVGIESADAATRVLDETFRAMPGYSREAHVAWTFVNYPLDMQPVLPTDNLPLTWKTERLEWYGFRNKWLGDDVCLFQAAVDAENRGAGAFRLSGFGTSWLAGKPGRREAENVVQLPGIDVDENAAALVTHYATDENGSGSLTLDYDPVYRTAETGVSGSRAMAVDYSGKSGAAAMVVIADRVDGFDAPVWSCPFLDFGTGLGKFKTGSTYRKNAPKGTDVSYGAVAKKFYDELLKEARALRGGNRDYQAYAERRGDLMSQFVIEGDTLRMTGNDGVVLQMRFFSNKPVTLKNDELEKVGLAAKMTIIYSLTSGIVARGGDEFLVVITLSKGEPPGIEGDPGRGLKTQVKVGKSTVHIENGNVVVR